MPKDWTERDNTLLFLGMALSKCPHLVVKDKRPDASSLAARGVLEFLESRGYTVMRIKQEIQEGIIT